MSAGKVKRSLAEPLQDKSNNGGESAGAINGARGAKPTPAAEGATTISPVILPGPAVDTEEFINKHHGNQHSKNRSQGKPSAAEIAATEFSLPPAAPINLGGRPPVITPEVLEQMCELLSLGFTRAQAAAHLGIDRSTVTRTAQRDPELAAELERAEEASELQPQLTIIAEARKNWRAAVWLIEHKAKRRRPSRADKEEKHQERMIDIEHYKIESAAGQGKRPEDICFIPSGALAERWKENGLA